ncbi:kremen protein 2 isoform X2 [Apteryx mantelli]|uniref:Kringle-containing protein marking the eye and the nose n=1 Tax=Apteryx mantelli TaxID=2696672 RepID=A0ABM4G1C2_9AVES
MAWVPGVLLVLRGAAALAGDEASECFTVNGADYRGAQSRTGPGAAGRPCLFWNRTGTGGADGSLRDGDGDGDGGGLGPHNHCRNPDGDARPWCYVADGGGGGDGGGGAEWKYCDIPSCRMPGFVGCFVDSGSPPALSGASGTSTRLTVPLCIRFCRARGYEFAGVEAGYACFCGHAGDVRRGRRAGAAECDQVCFGKASQLCGGDGRLAVYHVSVGACQANSTAPAGVIYSPDFPDDYGPDADCSWRVGAGAGAPLELTFRLFDVPDPNDRLQLRDARTRRLLAQFDGRRPPPRPGPLRLPTDALLLTFRSDTLLHAQGFALTYRGVAAPVTDTRPPPDARSPPARPHGAPQPPRGGRAWLTLAASGTFVFGLLLLLAYRLRKRSCPLRPRKAPGGGCGCLGGQPWAVSYRPHGGPPAPEPPDAEGGPEGAPGPSPQPSLRCLLPPS